MSSPLYSQPVHIHTHTHMHTRTHTHSYYPLIPSFRKEDHQQQQNGNLKTENPNSNHNSQPDDPVEVNFDLIHAFDDRHALLPVRPDVLFLPSDLKPFAKVRKN